MFSFFQYNWQVRDEWLEWCKQLTTKELLMNRVGGVDNILNKLDSCHPGRTGCRFAIWGLSYHRKSEIPL